MNETESKSHSYSIYLFFHVRNPMCICGRTKNQHDLNVAREDTGDQWTPERCTRQMQTDAYGEIDFLGTGSQNKRSPVSRCRPCRIDTVFIVVSCERYGC